MMLELQPEEAKEGLNKKEARTGVQETPRARRRMLAGDI